MFVFVYLLSCEDSLFTIGLFFEDLSGKIIHDDIFQRLVTFPNVLITAHQAFFTENAMQNIAETTINNITTIEGGQNCLHLVEPQPVVVNDEIKKGAPENPPATDITKRTVLRNDSEYN